VRWKLFANLAEAAGDRTVRVDADLGPDATVGDALDALVEAHPDLDPLVRADDGGVREHVNLLRNGEGVDLDAPVEEDDELALFPPVSGG
jgi:molybdopterin synthase sulfur carrier subunit